MYLGKYTRYSYCLLDRIFPEAQSIVDMIAPHANLMEPRPLTPDDTPVEWSTCKQYIYSTKQYSTSAGGFPICTRRRAPSDPQPGKIPERWFINTLLRKLKSQVVMDIAERRSTDPVTHANPAHTVPTARVQIDCGVSCLCAGTESRVERSLLISPASPHLTSHLLKCYTTHFHTRQAMPS